VWPNIKEPKQNVLSLTDTPIAQWKRLGESAGKEHTMTQTLISIVIFIAAMAAFYRLDGPESGWQEATMMFACTVLLGVLWLWFYWMFGMWVVIPSMAILAIFIETETD
jgi:hypothetical protein